MYVGDDEPLIFSGFVTRRDCFRGNNGLLDATGENMSWSC